MVSTPAGDIGLAIPKLRTGSFFPELLEPRRRIDKALWAVIMTAYITGTSTRKVDVPIGRHDHCPERLVDSLKETVEAARQRGNEATRQQGQTGLDAGTYHGNVSRYGKLVRQGFDANPKQARRKQSKTYNLLIRLDEHRQDVLRFASEFDAPFDNNQAERDIRMVKLQQKISGCWRTFSGAQHFLRVREHLSTARKQGQQALDVLVALFEGQCWMPGSTGV